MAAFDLITKDDLEKFKVELFAELKRPSYQLNKKGEQKEWLKSYEDKRRLFKTREFWRKFTESSPFDNAILILNQFHFITDTEGHCYIRIRHGVDS